MSQKFLKSKVHKVESMNYILFTTTRCPKCPEFKSFVSKNINFKGKILDETMPEFSEKIQELNVTAAPTIIIFEDGKEVFRASETYELEGFLTMS